MRDAIITEPAQRFLPWVLIVVAHCIKYMKPFLLLLKTSAHVLVTAFPPGAKSCACDIQAAQTANHDVTNAGSTPGRGKAAGVTEPQETKILFLWRCPQ